MTIAWHFNEARPGDKARESQVEKFFTSDAVANRANAIVREGIQNSLDAAIVGQVVRVRVALGTWNAAELTTRLGEYTGEFWPHLEAVRAHLPSAPTSSDALRYLVFEDFGTTGLRGDPAQWWPDEQSQSNPFFNYFRAEGLSDKTEGARGRHGVGRLVFTFASRARTIFGFTQRNDGEGYLMGTTVLRNHWHNQKPYLLDAWFGTRSSPEQPTLPIPAGSPFVARFKSDFNISRRDETGLTVVVPWVAEDVSGSLLVQAVLEGYFYPILQQSLVVDVSDESEGVTKISADTISDVVAAQSAEFIAGMKPVLSLAQASLASKERISIPPLEGDPKWSNQTLPPETRDAIHEKLEAGEMVAIRVPMRVRPKMGPHANSRPECHFDVFLMRDLTAGEGQIRFIREGIIISDARRTDGNRQIRCPNCRALVVIDDGPLATFLGDCENPSHTQWQHSYLKDKYTYGKMYLEYVVGAVPEILKLISAQQQKPDSSLLLDLFSLPSDDPNDPKARQARRKAKKGSEPPDPVPPVLPRSPKRYSVHQFKNGFAVRRGDTEAVRPPALEVEMAYDVRRGSAFAKYNKADFQLGSRGVNPNVSGGTILERDDNYLLVEVTDDDFEVIVTGFDTNRDLEVNVKIKELEVEDAATP